MIAPSQTSPHRLKNPWAFLLRLHPCELSVVVKWLLRVRRSEYTLGKKRLWLDPASNLGVRLLAEGDFEPELGRCLQTLLQPGDVFLDIGANEGWFSICAAELIGPAGTVIAFEPQQRLWPVILKNLAINNVSNVSLLPYALGTLQGRQRLTLAPSTNNGASTLAASPRERLWPYQDVVIKRLDDVDVVARYPKIKFAKVDVEGFEVEVLRSAGELLASRRVRYWYVEVHPRHLKTLGSAASDITSILECFGYRRVAREGLMIWEAP